MPLALLEHIACSLRHLLVSGDDAGDEVEHAVLDEISDAEVHQGLNRMEADIEHKGNGVLAISLHGAGVVLVEVVQDACNALKENLAAEERAHGGDDGEQQVGEVLSLVDVDLQLLVHLVGDHKRAQGGAGAEAEEHEGEDGLDEAEQTVPPGLYLVQINVETDKSTTRQVQPIAVVY